MKKRFVIWGAFLSLASLAAAASFHIPVRHMYTDAENAKSLGVEVAVYKKLNHLGAKIFSDVSHHRPIRDEEVNYLFDAAEKNGQLATHVMWSFYGLKHTPYQARALEIARKHSKSSDENEAFAALQTLKHLGDPTWKEVAEAYPWKCKDYRELILEPRRY